MIQGEETVMSDGRHLPPARRIFVEIPKGKPPRSNSPERRDIESHPLADAMIRAAERALGHLYDDPHR